MVEFRKKVPVEETLFSALWFFNYFKLIAGSLILASGLVFFIIPFKIVPGGVFGLSIVINHLTGFPVGLTAFFINIPLFLWGIKVLGNQFGFKTFFAMILTTLSIDIMTYFSEGKGLTDDILVSTIFGGVFIGTGIALILRSGGTSGGTDIIARIIAKLTKIQVGKLFLAVDGVIVLSSIIIFRKIDLAPYAIIAIFAISKTVDAILNGLDNRKAVFVISKEFNKIRQFILEDMDRGGTVLMSKGLYYTDEDRNIIFSALSRKELVKLQNTIRIIDKEAFLIVFDTHEIIGSGFKPL